jgi:hypothetical protein
VGGNAGHPLEEPVLPSPLEPDVELAVLLPPVLELFPPVLELLARDAVEPREPLADAPEDA